MRITDKEKIKKKRKKNEHTYSIATVHETKAPQSLPAKTHDL
jgi:hypothetical protein